MASHNAGASDPTPIVLVNVTEATGWCGVGASVVVVVGAAELGAGVGWAVFGAGVGCEETGDGVGWVGGGEGGGVGR